MIDNGVPFINGTQPAWGDIVVSIGGVPITGITGIEYDDQQEMSNIYGAGRLPVGRAKGRITATAKITLLQSEVQAIQAQSRNGRLQDIAPFDIVVSYLPDNGVIKTDKIRNVQFLKNAVKWNEGDTSQPVELDLICSHIEWAK